MLIPQGKILWPTLFLVYVDDISNVVTSSIKMFADNSKIYRDINDGKDTLALQSDLDMPGKLGNRLRIGETKVNILITPVESVQN